jgi:hypothetical protein
MEITEKAGIFWQWISWQFFDIPKNILKAWKNFLRFGFFYFSIPLLLKTLFSPWRRYIWFYPRGFDIGKYLEVWISNLMSRIIGAMMRIFLIIFGVIYEIFIFFVGAIVFSGWLILPVLLTAGLIFGFKVII